jgi:hypothetical protein
MYTVAAVVNHYGRKLDRGTFKILAIGAYTLDYLVLHQAVLNYHWPG